MNINEEKKVRWGIIALGGISHVFATELKHAPYAELVAVGSRSLERAQAFAEKHQARRAYGSYEELVNDSEIDIVYIATPHPMHKEIALLCIKAGKAVLCEKSFTINADELIELEKAAKEHRVFIMEAMWTRFLPTMAKIREWIASGAIGEVGMLDIRFGNNANVNPKPRLFSPELGGGALLDVGVYCISFASMIIKQQPKTIHSLVKIGETGVDDVFTSLFGYEQGPMVNIMAALRLRSKHEAVILGSKGEIRVADFWKAKGATLIVYDQYEEKFEDKSPLQGYVYEAIEAMDCMRKGKLESDVMPVAESIDIMRTMDNMRHKWNLRYPTE